LDWLFATVATLQEMRLNVQASLIPKHVPKFWA